MRIIGKTHDYYDSALAFGHDKNVVFERVEENHVKRWNHPLPEGYDFMEPNLGSRSTVFGRSLNEHDSNKKDHEFSYFPFTIAFCGRLYPGIRLDMRKGSTGVWAYDFAYSFEAYVSLLHQNGLKFIGTERKRLWRYSERSGSPIKEDDCKKYFERAGEDHITFFAEKRKPIVVYDKDSAPSGSTALLRFNPELKLWSFYKVFSAYTAFQELDMFISGVMSSPDAGAPTKRKPKRPNPVDISDEDLRDKKGFDDMSFKKAPTKKR